MHESLVRDQVVTILLANGGTDTEGSGFIFHFQTTQSLLGCRDTMRGVIPAVFHLGAGTVVRLNEVYNLQIDAPIVMAEAWTIYKTLVMATDYKADSGFFIAI